MTAIASRRRQRTTWALVCGLVGALMLPSGLVLAANSLLHSTDGNSVDASKVTREASFADDLEADSLDVVELVMELEEVFGVEVPED